MAKIKIDGFKIRPCFNVRLLRKQFFSFGVQLWGSIGKTWTFGIILSFVFFEVEASIWREQNVKLVK
jgi:hypothetical protein